MSKAIQDRLGQLIEATGLSNNAFAKRLGKSNSVIDNIVKGRASTKERHAPSYELLMLIIDAVWEVQGKKQKINPIWLMTGSGDMFGKTSAVKTGAPYYEIRATAGEVGLPDQDMREETAGYIDIPGLDCDYFLPVWGGSMFPDINSGDIIGVKKLESTEWIRWGEVHLIVTKEHRMVKFLRKGKDDKHVIAASKADEFDPIDVPKKDIIQLFIVKAVLKRRMN